jgi:hypothetical protein
MKKHIVTIICGAVILLSAGVIIRSLWMMHSGRTHGNPVDREQLVSSEEYTNPLTTIAFDEKLIDAGDLPADTTIYQAYVLRNTGDKPLIVYNVAPDCNCTDYSLSQKIALPGDSITVNLTVEMKNKKTGMFMVNTVVKVNTEKQLYLLRLNGNVID